MFIGNQLNLRYLVADQNSTVFKFFFVKYSKYKNYYRTPEDVPKQ